MLIDDSIDRFLSTTLEDIRQRSLPIHTRSCPHCGLPTRSPIVVQKQDVEDFRLLMDSVGRFMDDFGITANMLAEIRARCFIEIAKRNSRAE